MRRNSRIVRLIGAATAAALVFAVPAQAEEPPKSIEEVQRALDAAREQQKELARQAEAQIREIESLRQQLATAAAAAQESEANLSSIESRLAGLEAEEAAKAKALDERRAELATLLAALQRVARHPPEALVLMPESPLDTIRTARLLGAVIPPLEADAKQIARDVEDLQGLRELLVAEREALTTGIQRLAADRARLRDLTARRALVYRETETAKMQTAERIEALARQAEDMRDLLQKLNERRAREKEAAEKQQAEKPAVHETLQARVAEGLAGRLRRLGEPHGQMAFPARGRIVLAFGQAGEGGQPHRGLSIETRPDAQVVAPYDGQIVFAGPFRGYGRILIIEHGEGYHTLLAGLGRIDVSAGQVVATGEPIATTGSSDGSPPELDQSSAVQSLGASRTAGSGPILYVELRRRGQPINPLPWLATSTGKVSG